ncbi:MAG: hypothetical protein AB8U44_02335 [Aaplasma endosymbiont of Hyalomma asiaticum]
MMKTRLRSPEKGESMLGFGRRKVGVIRAHENDPRLDEKAYDLRSRIYTCYVLCTSMLCLIPIVPYYVSKELYKRGHKKGAAISMEIFKYSHCMLAFTLVFTKVILFLLKRRPTLLDNFFVKNQDLAVIVAAVMCATPVLCFVVIVRYYSVYNEVKTTGCSVVDALLARSCLTDVSEGVPVLICHTGDKGPLFISESKPYKKRYGADLIYDIYIYSTSYLLVLPSCFALLCKLFLEKKKRMALSVSRLLGVSSHVLLSNTIVICAIALMFDRFFSATSLVKLRADSAGVALLSGVLVSALILFVAVTFCYYEISKNIYDSSREISDSIASSVLKFGLLTVAVNCVCDIFRKKAKLLSRGWECEKNRFRYDAFRRMFSATLLVPAIFWQISDALLKVYGNKKASAIARRAWVYSEIFLDNFLVFSLVFYGIFSALTKFKVVHHHSIGGSAVLVGLISSAGFIVATAVHDFLAISYRVHLGNRERRWENIVINDDKLECQISNAGVLHMVTSGVIHAVDWLGEKVQRKGSARDGIKDSEFSPPVFFKHADAIPFCCNEEKSLDHVRPPRCNS